MKEKNLLVTKENKLKAKRAKIPYKSKPEPGRPNDIWDIEWLNALDNPLYLVSDNGSQPALIRFIQACKDLSIEQIFTSPLEADQPQADYNKPKANADTVCQRQIRLRRKRVRRTLKEDLIWIKEFTPPEELRQDLERWIHNYSARGRSTFGGNAVYPHFSLNYRTPLQPVCRKAGLKKIIIEPKGKN